MSEIFFTLRMALIAFVLVALMQIRFDNVTLEDHATEFIRTAAPVMFLRDVAEGGLAALHDSWAKVTSGIKTKYWSKYDDKNMPGRRQLNILSNRSDEYVAEQQAKVAAALEDKQRKEAEAKAQLQERAKKVKGFLGWEDKKAEKGEEPSSDLEDSNSSEQ